MQKISSDFPLAGDRGVHGSEMEFTSQCFGITRIQCILFIVPLCCALLHGFVLLNLVDNIDICLGFTYGVISTGC